MFGSSIVVEKLNVIFLFWQPLWTFAVGLQKNLVFLATRRGPREETAEAPSNKNPGFQTGHTGAQKKTIIGRRHCHPGFGADTPDRVYRLRWWRAAGHGCGLAPVH